uniref:Uncharacterized protein n=1 Tax=Anguilla anguilla TaxID=7936 RepID=A0A0E9S4C2_ANGAN
MFIHDLNFFLIVIMETFSEMKTTELLDSGIVSRWEC